MVTWQLTSLFLYYPYLKFPNRFNQEYGSSPTMQLEKLSKPKCEITQRRVRQFFYVSYNNMSSLGMKKRTKGAVNRNEHK